MEFSRNTIITICSILMTILGCVTYYLKSGKFSSIPTSMEMMDNRFSQNK